MTLDIQFYVFDEQNVLVSYKKQSYLKIAGCNFRIFNSFSGASFMKIQH
jgi:hypothetical protein